MMQKTYDFLGLAQRAGKLQSGEASAEANLVKGNGKLVLLASDASDKTKRHFSYLSEQFEIPYIVAGEKMNLGIAIGKSARAVIVVTDKNFALKIKDLIGENDTIIE